MFVNPLRVMNISEIYVKKSVLCLLVLKTGKGGNKKVKGLHQTDKGKFRHPTAKCCQSDEKRKLKEHEKSQVTLKILQHPNHFETFDYDD